MKKQIRKAMICTIAMMVAAIVSLTGVTYAWFTQGNQASVDGMSVTLASSNGGVLISETANAVDSEWKFSLTLTSATYTNMKPASTAPGNISNGDLKFYEGVFDRGNTTDLTSKEVTGNTYFIKKDLFLRPINNNDEGKTIQFKPILTTQTGDITNQAIKIAIVNQGSYTYSTAIDAEAKDCKTSDKNNVAICDFVPDTHHKTGTSQSGFYGLKAEGTFSTTHTNTSNPNVLEAYTPKYPDKATGATFPEFTMTTGQCQKVTVYIWFEGQDVDCINEIAENAKSIGISLNFVVKEDL